jgi:hypothetical protein
MVWISHYDYVFCPTNSLYCVLLSTVCLHPVAGVHDRSGRCGSWICLQSKGVYLKSIISYSLRISYYSWACLKFSNNKYKMPLYLKAKWICFFLLSIRHVFMFVKPIYTQIMLVSRLKNVWTVRSRVCTMNTMEPTVMLLAVLSTTCRDRWQHSLALNKFTLSLL